MIFKEINKKEEKSSYAGKEGLKCNGCWYGRWEGWGGWDGRATEGAARKILLLRLPLPHFINEPSLSS